MPTELLDAIRSESRELSCPLSTRLAEEEMLRLRAAAQRLGVRVAVLTRIAVVRVLPELEAAALRAKNEAGGEPL
jgi:hypothetical protein